MIEITEVLFVNLDDPDFMPRVEHGVILINGELILDIDHEGWLFRTVTGEREVMRVVNLEVYGRVKIVTKANPIDLPELIELPLAEALKKLAK